MKAIASRQALGKTFASNKPTVPIPEYGEQQEAEDTLKTDSSMARSSKMRESASAIYSDTKQGKARSRRNISAMNIVDAQSASEISVQDQQILPSQNPTSKTNNLSNTGDLDK